MMCNCYSSKHISTFSANHVELGMSKQNFIFKYGKPFNQETQYNKENQLEEKIFYKKELNSGGWYAVTTCFTFQNSRLIKQKSLKRDECFKIANAISNFSNNHINPQ